jgi:hypothetical protein
VCYVAVMQLFPHVSTTPTPLCVLCCGHASVPSCEYNTDPTLCVMLRPCKPLPVNIACVTDIIVDSCIILSTGGLCCIWIMFWVVLVRDSPADHPRITRTEKHFIIKNIEFDTTKRVIIFSCLDNDYRVYVLNKIEI